MTPFLEFLKRRFGETSSWIHIGTAFATAVGVPAPWCYLVFTCNAVGVLMPDAQLIGAWKKMQNAE